MDGSSGGNVSAISSPPLAPHPHPAGGNAATAATTDETDETDEIGSLTWRVQGVQRVQTGPEGPGFPCVVGWQRVHGSGKGVQTLKGQRGV